MAEKRSVSDGYIFIYVASFSTLRAGAWDSSPARRAGAAGTSAGSHVHVSASWWWLLAGSPAAFRRHVSRFESLPQLLAGAEPGAELSPAGGRLGCGRHQLMPWGSPSGARSHRRAGSVWGAVGVEVEGPDALLPGSLAELGGNGGLPWGALWSSRCLWMQKGRLTWRLQGHAGWRGALLLWTEGRWRQGCEDSPSPALLTA